MIRSFAFTIVALSIAGCSIIPKPAPADIVYRLSVSGESVPANADAAVIRVDRPSATSVFNSRSIVVSPDGRRLSTAAQAQWPEGTPTMLQGALVDAFSRDASIVGVLPESGTRTDTRVHFTIKNFEAQFDRGQTAAPLAVVRYTATLASATDRRLIDTLSTRQEVRAAAASVSDIVTAMEQANDAAMTDIVAWVVESNRKGMIATAKTPQPSN